MSNDIGLIIQLPVTGHWGTDTEMDLRGEIETALEEEFQRQGCGVVDGGDIGSGTMNIFTYTDEKSWDRALALVVDQLKRRGLLDRATIAKSVPVGDDDDPYREHTVVWPENFEGPFSLF